MTSQSLQLFMCFYFNISMITR